MAASASGTELATLQQNYVDQGYGMFVCYSPGSFTGEDWAHSNLNVDTFTPTGSIKAATDQWAATAKAAGMTYGIFTAKHVDGFALWDASNSTYDVASTSWYNASGNQNNHVDIVQSYADSFRAQGLGVGLYYSMWDQHAGIGTKYYADEQPVTQLTVAQANAYVEAQLHDLLTNYGQIDCLFTDAWANYGAYGVNYTRPDFTTIYNYVKSVSPNTLLLENNGATDLNYTDLVSYEHYNQPLPSAGNSLPAEVSTTLRTDSKWFYAASGADSLKSANSVGGEIRVSNAHNATYALDVTPDLTGNIPANQVQRLQDIKTYLAGFRPGNLALGEVATQSSSYFNGYSSFTGYLALDGDTGTFASTDNGDYNPSWTVDLGKLTPIGEVDLLNRADQNSLGRLRDITIEILAADGTTVLYTSPLLNPGNVLGGGINDYAIGPNSLSWLTGPGVTGEFIRIRRTAEGSADANQYLLSMAEVAVYATPEPGTLALLACGLLSLLAYAWRARGRVGNMGYAISDLTPTKSTKRNSWSSCPS
jgi:alpha-L-fucosidase